MNHHDRDESRPEHLSEILGTLAASAAQTHSGRTPETLLATARRHGTAARRRQTRARALVAAASVAAIAVGGVVIAQHLGDVAPPPPATQTAPTVPPTADPGAAFPACGAAATPPEHLTTLRLVTEAVTDADGKPATTSPAGAAPFLTDSRDELFPVALANQGDSSVTVGSTGYAAFVVVRDGVVVGATDAMREPYREDTVAPGGLSPAFEPAGIAMCDGPDAPLAGTYALYSYVDVTFADPDGAEGTLREPTRVWGGPWEIRIGSTVGGADQMALECRMPTSEITAPEYPEVDGTPVAQLDVTPPQSSVPVTPVLTRTVRVDPRGATDNTYFGDAVEVYLIRDGEVVSLRSTPAPGGPWYIGTPDSWPDVVEETGATPAEGLFPEISGVDCQTGEPLAEGEYEMLVVVPMWVPDYQFPVFAPRERITLGDGPVLPALDPKADFPQCGAAVPGFSDTALVVQESTTSPWSLSAPTGSAPDGLLTDLSVRNESDRRWAGRLGTVRAVLTLDGRVVSPPSTLDAPTGSVALDPGDAATLQADIVPDTCGGAGTFPDGTYEVWVLVDHAPTKGAPLTSVGRLGTVTYDFS